MMWAETRGNHVFVFWRGVLIYKRWLDRGCGVVMEACGSNGPPGTGRRDVGRGTGTTGDMIDE